MKKLFALLLAAMMLLGAASAMADGITFEGHAWGATANKIAPNGFWSERTAWYFDAMVFTGVNSEAAAWREGRQLTGGLYYQTLADVAGYQTLADVYCAYDVKNGYPARSRDTARLYLVNYIFLNLEDLDAAYADLVEKLNAQYGEGETYFEGDPREADAPANAPHELKATIWTDGTAKMVLSVAHFSEDYAKGNDRLSLAMGTDSDAMLDALTEALYAEDDYRREHGGDLPGDANRDGAVNLDDVLTYAVGNGVVDSNHDGSFNMADAVNVLNYLCGGKAELVI